MNKYRIKVIQSLDLFWSCSVEWRYLLQKSSADSIFTTWEWLYTWSKYFLTSDCRLLILMVYKNNDLVGIAPFYLKNNKYGPFQMRQIEFLGTPEAGSDYLDVITLPGEEGQVSSRIYEYLFREIGSSWDMIHLRDVPSNSLFFLKFLTIFEENGKHIEVSNGSFCPVVVLPGEKETFFESLSRNRREQFRRHLKILCGSGELHHVVRQSSDLNKDIHELKNLHRKRWEGEQIIFFKFLEEYIDRSKDEGIVQLDLLKKNHECIAAIMHLNYNYTRYMYLFAVDKEHNNKISVGNVFLCMCIQKAIDDKIIKYDLLKGDEPYKFHFTHQGNRLLNISHYQKRIGTVLYCSNRYMKNIGKILLR